MNVRRSLAAAVIALGVPALSSCGFDVQTDQVYNPAVGVDERDGTVDVLNGLIVSGSDGSGTLVATLVNNDTTSPDSLSGVEGPGLEVTPGGKTSVPADGLLNLAEEGKIEVRGERVVPGNFVEVTFSFDRGESVTAKVPVVSADDPVYADVPLPSGS